MKRPTRRSSTVSAAKPPGTPPCFGAWGAVAFCLAIAPAAVAVPWEADAGDLGRTAHRFALHIGGSWGILTGVEVPDADAGFGFEIAASSRVWKNLSLSAGYARHSSNVQGQVVQLLDTYVRPDRRSGSVDGKIDVPRLRGGVRIDAYRVQEWRFQVYAMGGVMYSFVEATLDTIDGQPPQPYEGPDGRTVDPGTITADLLGMFGRVGAEYLAGERLGVDASFTFETVDPPPGTNDLVSFALGAVYRF
jgi:hypothetical protein